VHGHRLARLDNVLSQERMEVLPMHPYDEWSYLEHLSTCESATVSKREELPNPPSCDQAAPPVPERSGTPDSNEYK
jgi:hypothetical protein